ncbi:MAG: hypothetical protein WBY53_10835 [Acidobacteriaceae bacterium]
MRREIRLLPLIVLAATLAISAQTTTEAPRAPDRPGRMITPGIDVMPFPNLPFSGTDTIVQHRYVAGGSPTVSYITARIARDSQGRIYRERHHFGSQTADPQSTLDAFDIYDPTTSSRTLCYLAEHHCVVTSYHPQLIVSLRPAGPFNNGKEFLARDTLGQQTIQDFTATGTRETVTISPDTIGNQGTLTLTREFWYSPDLKTNLAVLRTDPRFGVTDVHLNIQSRDEPDPSLFTVPTTFTVTDERTAPQPVQ